MPLPSRWARWFMRRGRRRIVPWIYRNPDDGLYHRHWIVVSVLLSGFLLFSLWKWKPDQSRPAGRRVVSGSAEPAC